ncbi:two-component system response regulator QseB [Salmonella enterica subsp. enterica]|nr:two-component system response regulator QseB [Salmonella enterica subsp. enterica]
MRILFILDRNNFVYSKICAEIARDVHSIDKVIGIEEGQFAISTVSYCASVLTHTVMVGDRAKILTLWRKQGIGIPLLILTQGDSSKLRSDLLNAGADDCMEIPADSEELLARIYSIIRRSHTKRISQLCHGDLVLNTATRKVTHKGEVVRMTARETILLEVFMINASRVLTKTFLEEKICSWERDFCSNALEVHISNIRRKLGRNIIHTMHGVGYQLGAKPNQNR